MRKSKKSTNFIYIFYQVQFIHYSFHPRDTVLISIHALELFHLQIKLHNFYA